MSPKKSRLPSFRKHTRPAAGFTLVEILLVIALIGVVTGVVVVNLSGTGTKAKINAAQTFVNNSLEAPIMLYQQQEGVYPPNIDAIKPFLKKKEAPQDPWKKPYLYKYPGTHNTDSYDIWSTGPDRQSGTPDDIGNW